MQCPKCGVENDEKLRFCRACGGALAANLPAESAASAATERLPAVTPPAAPPPAAPPPAPPMPAAPPVAAPPPVYTPPPAQTAPRSNTPLIIGLVIGAVLLVLIAVVAVAGFYAWNTAGKSVTTEVSTTTQELPDGKSSTTTSATTEEGDKEASAEEGTGESGAQPVSSTDSVAEATVVLEKYLAADLGHDGQEMKKYLGGQAAARFNPDVVGQEDLTVHSKQITAHNVRDDNTIEFTVSVKWSPSDSSEVKTETQSYVLKRTEQGWLIFSTPEFPEG